MARYRGTLFCEPGKTIHEALRDAFFDDLLGLREFFRAGDARNIEAERIGIFFDGSGVNS